MMQGTALHEYSTKPDFLFPDHCALCGMDFVDSPARSDEERIDRPGPQLEDRP